MIITKCDKCGELMDKAGRCLACGNISCFTMLDSTLTIHENVKDEYENLENLVKNGKFTEALGLSKVVLKWMPNCSDVFWLRLLAKNRCDSDEALIRKGVSCEDSSDYYNAVMFANKTQKKVYLSVAAKISAVKKVLSRYITEHEYCEKNNTMIVQIQSEFPSKIESHRKKLFQLWEELRQVEVQMVSVEKDCLLLVREHKETLDRASSEASSIKAATYKMDECSAEQLHKYQIQFDNLLYLSEQAETSIDSMRKQHPWMETYHVLVTKRDSIISQINNEINTLKAYERRVQSTVSEIERIEARHSAALVSATKYNFAEIRSLLGENRFMSAYVEAGIK